MKKELNEMIKAPYSWKGLCEESVKTKVSLESNVPKPICTGCNIFYSLPFACAVTAVATAWRLFLKLARRGLWAESGIVAKVR